MGIFPNLEGNHGSVIATTRTTARTIVDRILSDSNYSKDQKLLKRSVTGSKHFNSFLSLNVKIKVVQNVIRMPETNIPISRTTRKVRTARKPDLCRVDSLRGVEGRARPRTRYFFTGAAHPSTHHF